MQAAAKICIVPLFEPYTIPIEIAFNQGNNINRSSLMFAYIFSTTVL